MADPPVPLQYLSAQTPVRIAIEAQVVGLVSRFTDGTKRNRAAVRCASLHKHGMVRNQLREGGTG